MSAALTSLPASPDRLHAELQRLFAPAGAPPGQLLAADGRVRLLWLDMPRSADWPALAELLAGIGQDLGLPLPALSVAASGGYCLWFSLAEAITPAQGSALLAALLARYVPDLPAGRVGVRIPTAADAWPDLPCAEADSGRWSAWIDPGLGALFADEAGLDLAPGRDRQADLLVSVRSWTRSEYQRAGHELAAAAGATPAATAPLSAVLDGGSGTPSVAAAGACSLPVLGTYRDPRAFLLAVMNDATAAAEHRLRAAEALLPYYAGQPLAD